MEGKLGMTKLPEENSSDYLVATYYLETENMGEDLYEYAKNIALDQSAGTWTSVSGETSEMMAKYGAKVVGVYSTSSETSNSCITRIAYPTVNFPPEIPMILTTVIGNVSAQKGVKLLDIEIPDAFLKEMPGPILGVSGIRKQLKAPKRPLIGAILKPCIGVEPEVSAEGAAAAAAGGVDVIKDDELLSEPGYSPMVKRVSAVMKHIEQLKMDKTILYTVNITGKNLLDRAERAIEAGANALMVNHFTLGWGIVEDLIKNLRDKGYEVPVLGHLAGAGAAYMSKNSGISASLICGKLPRLLGLDMSLVYPNQGRFGFSTNELIKIHSALTGDFKDVTKSLPMVAGGLHPGKVPYLVDLLGNDILLQAGGGIYGHPRDATAGAKAMLQASKAVQEGKSLEDAAKENKELEEAINHWGVYNGE
jgi:2,3-diketo-5-methylthiopentyl-1-phosphate enolase